MKIFFILGMYYVDFPSVCTVAKNNSYEIFCFDIDQFFSSLIIFSRGIGIN